MITKFKNYLTKKFFKTKHFKNYQIFENYFNLIDEWIHSDEFKAYECGLSSEKTVYNPDKEKYVFIFNLKSKLGYKLELECNYSNWVQFQHIVFYLKYNNEPINYFDEYSYFEHEDKFNSCMTIFKSIINQYEQEKTLFNIIAKLNKDKNYKDVTKIFITSKENYNYIIETSLMFSTNFYEWFNFDYCNENIKNKYQYLGNAKKFDII